MTSTTIPLELALQAVIKQHMDAIVYAAEKDAALLEGSGMDKNQLQNVLNVAEESHSLAVVVNFIRYQMGRQRTGPNWCYDKKGTVFGQRLIDRLISSDGIVQTQTQAVLSTMPEASKRKVQYEFMRHYLGYLRRAFVYAKEVGGAAWKNLRESS